MEVGNYKEGVQLCNKALKRQPDLHIVKVRGMIFPSINFPSIATLLIFSIISLIDTA